MQSMKDTIIKRLEELEQKHNIHILLAVESGSRMWGFASKNSDYDVRFIYVNDPRYYLSVSKHRDCVEYTDKEYDLDMVGWDIKKALELLKKSNMSLYEWLHSPVVYKSTSESEELKALADRYWNIKALTYSYLHVAVGNYKIYVAGRGKVKTKKYLYILRTLAACMCMEQTQTSPAITIDGLLPYIQQDNATVADTLKGLIAAKKNGEELGLETSNERLNKWIEQKIKHYEKVAFSLDKPKPDYKKMDDFLYELVSRQILQQDAMVSSKNKTKKEIPERFIYRKGDIVSD